MIFVCMVAAPYFLLPLLGVSILPVLCPQIFFLLSTWFGTAGWHFTFTWAILPHLVDEIRNDCSPAIVRRLSLVGVCSTLDASIVSIWFLYISPPFDLSARVSPSQCCGWQSVMFLFPGIHFSEFHGLLILMSRKPAMYLRVYFGTDAPDSLFTSNRVYFAEDFPSLPNWFLPLETHLKLFQLVFLWSACCWSVFLPPPHHFGSEHWHKF